MKSIRLRNIKKGQKFREHGHGLFVTMEALEDAHRVNTKAEKGYAVTVKVLGGSCTLHTVGAELRLFEAHKPCGYGLHLTDAE